jgi:4-hydroxy-3-methylbut-2-enyl diphosphate reductase
MCFGVRDAIALALNTSLNKPLTVLGDLVHNEIVLARLRQHGIRVEQQVAQVPTRDVMISAHGASDKTILRARQQGLRVIEATCPLVKRAHLALQNLVRAHYHPVIIAKRDHVEVRGLTEDLETCDVVLNESDIDHLEEHARFGVVCQTTQPADRARLLVERLRRRFPLSEVRYVDTICHPTKQRQHAATDLARKCDVVVVIGGANSNNTHELAGACSQFCAHVYHVCDKDSLREKWFWGARAIGITAGTSTLDETIDEVEDWLYNHCNHNANSQELAHAGV